MGIAIISFTHFQLVWLARRHQGSLPDYFPRSINLTNARTKTSNEITRTDPMDSSQLSNHRSTGIGGSDAVGHDHHAS